MSVYLTVVYRGTVAAIDAEVKRLKSLFMADDADLKVSVLAAYDVTARCDVLEEALQKIRDCPHYSVEWEAEDIAAAALDAPY